MAAADFTATFDRLRGMLKKHAAKLVVTADTPTNYMVASPVKKDRTGRPLFVAAVQIKKTYVSYHLMPVYAIPAITKSLSPELKKRKQGKGCFNFKTIDAGQVRELSTLTKSGIAQFNKITLPWEQIPRK